MSDALFGKVALVTGGSRGIGAAIVRRLAGDGASVAFTYAASEVEAHSLRDDIEAAGARILAIRANSADSDAVRDAVARTVSRSHGLDILGNNAGILVRGMAVLLAFSMLLIMPASSVAQQLPPAAEEMAKTHGLDSFGEVEAIRYTWGKGNISRTWVWQPKTDTVTYEGKDKDGKPVKVTYRRSDIESQSDTVKNDIDPSFVHDQYLLLLPLHVAWDGANVTDEGMDETPLGKASAERIVVKYASSGYSPGDTYELFVGPDKRLLEMRYHRAVRVPGSPTLVLEEFGGYKKAGPLLISTDHPGTGDGHPIRSTFTDVAVKVTGSKNWILAH